jgi:iron complex outermembrane recepter protein
MFAGLLVALLSFEQPSPPATQPAPPVPPPAPLVHEERVEVVAPTPLHGVGLPILKVPANVQAFTATDLRHTAVADLVSLLASQAGGVQISEAQGGTLQPDVIFRGFVASPLLGASEGLAVYQDGARLNEPFGDTVHWDAIPSSAIASVNLIPGSNPAFGLNALGGAVSIRTKDGFAFPGHRASPTIGSFGRQALEAESGGHAGALGYFVAAALLREDGWRDFSPSRLRRLFGDLAWRGERHAANVSLTAASNRLTGNGAAPIDLLEQHRRAVFTHPDETDVDMALLTLRTSQHLSERARLQAVAYHRRGTIGTFNGDLGDDDDDDDDAHDDDDDGDDEYPAVNNTSRSRSRGTGATLQVTRTAPAWGRENHFVAGAGFDTGATRFAFASEWAELTPERGTVGSGLFDDEAFIRLDSRTSTASAFVTNTWSAGAGVAVSASARANWTDVRLRDRRGTALNGDHTFQRVNPAAGLTWTARGGLNLYGGYSQSSRVPTPVELTCADPEDPCRLPNAFVSDPPLKQIVARTWEAGLRGTGPAVRWALAAFATAARDDIIFVNSGRGRGQGHFENVAGTDRRGIEARIDGGGDRLQLFASYTWQHATFDADLDVASPHHPLAVDGAIAVAAGDRLPGVPAHVGKAGMRLSLTDAVRVGLTARGQSGQHLRGDGANRLPPLPGFLLVDGQLRAQVTAQVAIVLQAQNLLDARAETFGVLGENELPGRPEGDPRFVSPGAPRAAWIALDVRF